MNSEYIYLDDIRDDIKTNKQKDGKLPAGIKYNCFKCKKNMVTQNYGSYKYCLSCFNKWEKTMKNKTNTPKEKAIIESNEEFIDT